MIGEGALKTAGQPVGGSDSIPVTISVIISSYNAREVLADCLHSIYRNPPNETFEIIVVDDASADGTSNMVKARFPEVRLLRNEINCHYTKSNNRALAVARGQYVLLLNNDTIVLPKALELMVAFLREHPEAGAVGSRLLNEDGTTQWSVKALPTLGSALFGGRAYITKIFPNNRFTRKRFLHFDRNMFEPFVAGYLSGASKMMPRAVIEKIGELDVRMFYHVDADYCKRIVDAGYLCYYLPRATVVHLNHKGGTMVSTVQRFKSLLSFHVDCYVYFCKHLLRPVWSPMWLVILAGLVLHFAALAAVQLCTEAVRYFRLWIQPQASGP
jgi:GT2 family glycosyltransferase